MAKELLKHTQDNLSTPGDSIQGQSRESWNYKTRLGQNREQLKVIKKPPVAVWIVFSFYSDLDIFSIFLP